MHSLYLRCWHVGVRSTDFFFFSFPFVFWARRGGYVQGVGFISMKIIQNSPRMVVSYHRASWVPRFEDIYACRGSLTTDCHNWCTLYADK